MTGRIIVSIILALFFVFAITRTVHYNRAIKAHPDQKKWSKLATLWLMLIFVPIIIALVIWYPSLKQLSNNKSAPPAETISGNSSSAQPEETVSENTLPAETETSTEIEATSTDDQSEAEQPPEQAEDVYDEQYADILVAWEKTASEQSRRYLPKREPDMTDEEYKGVVMTWLQSEDLDEEFIPRDLTEEEAILYVQQFFPDFDINAVVFDRGCMPSSTTRRQRTVREQVQAYYNDPKLEGWSDAVLPSTTFQLFWDVYGTKNQHSDEWKALIAGKTVPAETWSEKYDLEIEEEELDLDGFMEVAFWQPMLYQCVHNPVYADEKAQLLLLVEEQFPGWLDNAPSVQEYVDLYDEAMKTDEGITNLTCKVECDDGHYETCVRPEVAIKGVNVYLAYRRLEINAKDPVQAKESTINFHLPPADGNYVRTEALTDPEDQESEPAFILSLRYKNRKQAAEVGVNIFDARDIIYIAKKPAAKVPEKPSTPNTPPSTPNTPPSTPDTPDTPDDPPTPTPTPGYEKNPEDDPGKNPEVPSGTNNPEDGLGEPEPTQPPVIVTVPEPEQTPQPETTVPNNEQPVSEEELKPEEKVDGGTPPPKEPTPVQGNGAAGETSTDDGDEEY